MMLTSSLAIFWILSFSGCTPILTRPANIPDENIFLKTGQNSKLVPQFLLSNSNKSDQTTNRISTCQIKFVNKEFQEYFQNIKDSSAELVHIYLQFPNYTFSPLGVVGQYYQPDNWYLSTYMQGLTLLKLPFQYDVYSLTVLQFGVHGIVTDIQDIPDGCLGEISQEKRMSRIRQSMFNVLNGGQPMPTASLCNLVIRSSDGAAQFVNQCCAKDVTGIIVCHDEEAGTWISILYWLLSGLYLVFFLSCPLLLPQSMYNAAYVMSEYMVKLETPVRMKLFVSNSLDSVVKYRWRLLNSDINTWNTFFNTLQDLPKNQIVPIQVAELQIKVKGKRIFEGNYPPSGLLQSLYDNFIRCKIKNIKPFTECCESSIYGKCADMFINYNITWHTCMKIFIKVLLLLLLPTPFYIRVFVFYYYENVRYKDRRLNAMVNRLETVYDFKTDTFLQYLTPVHPVFIASYLVYIFSGLIISFTGPATRDKIKTVFRSSLQNMCDVTYVSGVQMLTRLALDPFKTFGILGFLIAPLYWVVVVPLGLLLFLLYSIPTAYLAIAAVRHSIEQFPIFEEKPRRIIPKKASEKIRLLTSQLVANPFANIGKVEMQPTTRKEQAFRLLQLILVIVFCLSVLFTFVLLLSECLIFFLKVVAFTMMGIIINAGSTLKYVTMGILVMLYMNDCYQGVYENYVTFTKEIINILTDRAENIKEVASLSADEQNNSAFQINLPKTAIPIPTTFNNDKGEPRWNVGHLSLFLDKYDTPRLPLRLFQRMCEIKTWGCPGVVSINLLRATKKFVIIVVFLAFVLIVVLAFGNVYQVSSANQTLATMAGGFVPLLLKNVFSSSVVKLNLKTLSFKGQMDEVLADYRQNWPISDFSFIWGTELAEADKPLNETETFENSDAKSQTEIRKIEDGVHADDTETFENSDAKSQTEIRKIENGVHTDDTDHHQLSRNGVSVLSLEQPTSDDDEEVDIFIDLSSGVNENTWHVTPPETPAASYMNLNPLSHSTPMKLTETSYGNDFLAF